MRRSPPLDSQDQFPNRDSRIPSVLNGITVESGVILPLSKWGSFDVRDLVIDIHDWTVVLKRLKPQRVFS